MGPKDFYVDPDQSDYEYFGYEKPSTTDDADYEDYVDEV